MSRGASIGRPDEGKISYTESKQVVKLTKHLQRARFYSERGDWAKAMHFLKKQVRKTPDSAECHYQLARAYSMLGMMQEALAPAACAAKLSEAQKEFVDPVRRGQYFGLAGALFVQNRFYPEGLHAACAATQLDQKIAYANTAGIALAAIGRYTDAREVLEECVKEYAEATSSEENPDGEDFLDALVNLMLLETYEGDANKSADRGTALMEKFPNKRIAHDAALINLWAGRFAKGWEYMDMRDKFQGFPQSGKPEWDGNAHPDSTLLIRAEQGFGDLVLQMRFIPAVCSLFKEIVLEVPPAAVALVRKHAPINLRVLTHRETVENWDFETTVLRISKSLRVEHSDYETTKPYLEFEKWEIKKDKPIVGISWQGNRAQKQDHFRSIKAEKIIKALEPYKDKFNFVSLMKGEKISVPWIKNDYWEKINGIADLGEVVSNCDFIISVCSLPAHLAGAIGVPCYVLLSRACYWVWGYEGDSTSIYPASKLLRQEVQGNWEPVFTKLQGILNEYGK